jgi:lysophospholipase L1-like esterase
VKLKTLTLAVLASIILIACGGGGGSGAAPAQAETSQANAPQGVTSVAATKSVSVAAFGDSTQVGLSGNGGPGYTPAVAAMLWLQTVLNRGDVEVVSYGRGGTNSAQLLAGTDGSGLPWAKRLASVPNASIVTINHAINDNSRALSAYEATLLELVRVAQASGRTVVLETPNPMVAGGPLSSRFDIPKFEQQVQIMRDVAAATGATLCDEYAAMKQAHMDTLTQIPDGVHPNEDTYIFKGRTLGACLLPLVKAKE